MDIKSLKSFLEFNYEPINTKYVLSRMLAILIFNLLVIYLSKIKLFSILIYLMFYLFFIGLSIRILIIKNRNYKNKFLFDGVFSIYLSILFFRMSYLLFTFGKPNNYLIFFLMIFIMCANIFFVLKIVKNNIKKKKYNEKNNILKIYIFSLVGAVIGIVFARVVTPSFNQEFMLIVVSFIFFLMALIFETGIIEFLKLYYYKKYKEELNII